MALYNAPLCALELQAWPERIANDDLPQGAERRGHRQCTPGTRIYPYSTRTPGQLSGNSILKGLPLLGKILLQIYQTIGLNWERVGNVHFAVTYKPHNDAMDRAFAKERALQVAKEWGEAMNAGGRVKDFVAVGDVDIRVIGADNQILDSEVPVRQMLEQFYLRRPMPPFLLGLNWSSTERYPTSRRMCSPASWKAIATS